MGTHLGAVQCHFTDFSVEHRGLSRLRLSEFFQFYWVVRRPRPQVPTSRALPWIQRKLGKQYLRNKVTLLRESNPGAVSPTASSQFFFWWLSSDIWVKSWRLRPLVEQLESIKGYHPKIPHHGQCRVCGSLSVVSAIHAPWSHKVGGLHSKEVLRMEIKKLAFFLFWIYTRGSDSRWQKPVISHPQF